jgi:hypothetical protein
MSSHGSAIAALMLLMLNGGPARGSDEPPRNPYEHDSSVTGRVEQIHAPRLFTMAPDNAKGDELLVFVPNAESTPLVGTTVAARGIFRWFEDAGIEHSDDWSGIDERMREELASHAVLVASSVVTSTRRELAARRTLPRMVVRQPSQAERPAQTRRPELPIAVRPGTLGDHLNSLAGRFVRMPNARVVGVFDPRVFLVDTQTELPPLVARTRVLVFIEAGALRVDAATLVASTVTVSGVARTLLGMKVTREVPWPPALTRQLVEHLDINAAVLARSVQTADGVDLTVRVSAAPETSAASRRADAAADRGRRH